MRLSLRSPHTALASPQYICTVVYMCLLSQHFSNFLLWTILLAQVPLEFVFHMVYTTDHVHYSRILYMYILYSSTGQCKVYTSYMPSYLSNDILTGSDHCIIIVSTSQNVNCCLSVAPFKPLYYMHMTLCICHPLHKTIFLFLTLLLFDRVQHQKTPDNMRW